MPGAGANAMLPARRCPPENRLLASLPQRDARPLLDQCEPVELEVGEVVHEANARIRSVFFPTGSFISLMVSVDDASRLEVGLVGNEGVLGLPLVLGVHVSPLQAVVQGPGPAWRVGARAFLFVLGRRPALRRALHRYLQVTMSQLSHAAACTRFHMVEQRLARLLLMTQDRAQADQLHVTHEFLAAMLGVRRVGVTNAARALQARELIRYRRGELRILDRAGMEAASCGCYRADRQAYESLLATPSGALRIQRARIAAGP
jgi:CRP-like cAMP-binding protein